VELLEDAFQVCHGTSLAPSVPIEATIDTDH
jgi:hypothetical protein